MKTHDSRGRMRWGAGSVALAGLLAAVALPATAIDVVLGVGTTDFSRAEAGDEGPLSVELHGRPFERFGHRFGVHPAVALVSHANDNYWTGGELAAHREIGTGPRFLEAGLMAGFCHEEREADDLGGSVQFRTLIVFGYEFGNALRLSVAAELKSNAGLGDDNPGVDPITRRVGRRF